MLPTLNLLPDWWVRATNPMAWSLREQERLYIQQTQRVIDGGDADQTAHVTIFHELRYNSDLPADEKTRERLVAEAGSIVGAGTLTTAHMLSLTLFFLLKHPDQLARLRAELGAATPSGAVVPGLQALEKLPYLDAVIHEGLRLSYGVMHRLTRSQPNSTLHFRDWVIPPNTPVGMTPYLLHTDAAIFPEPRTWNPQRWMDRNAAGRDQLARYLGNFGRGSRQCAGMRLAYAEMYLTVAYVVVRLGSQIQLYDTEYERDVEYRHDYFIPAPSFQSRGVRVVQA